MHELTTQEIVSKTKESLEYAKIVVDDKDLVNQLSQEDFLTIGKTSPEHALLILRRQYLIDKILGRIEEYNPSDISLCKDFSFNSNWQALIYLGLSSAEAAKVVLDNHYLTSVLNVVQPPNRFYGAQTYIERLMYTSSHDKNTEVKQEIKPENKKTGCCIIL